MNWLIAYALAFFACVWIATSRANWPPDIERIEWVELDETQDERAYKACMKSTEMQDYLLISEDSEQWALVYACTIGVRAAMTEKPQ